MARAHDPRHTLQTDPAWVYTVTYGPREGWLYPDEPPEGEGWERNKDAGLDGWDRFDTMEVTYWRRRRSKTASGLHTAEGRLYDDAGRFHGFSLRECGEHRTAGSNQAWCYMCYEWCYPTGPCVRCEVVQLRRRLSDLIGA